MNDHSEKGSKMEESPNKEKIQFYKVFNQLRQHDDFIDDIVYDVNELTQEALEYDKKINRKIDESILIKLDLLAAMGKNNPQKWDIERISQELQNKWKESKTDVEENLKENLKCIYIEATGIIMEHGDAMQQEGGYSDEYKVKDILVRTQRLKDRVKKTQGIMNELLDSSRGVEKDRISYSEKLAMKKAIVERKHVDERKRIDWLIALKGPSFGILSSDHNVERKKEDIKQEANFRADSKSYKQMSKPGENTIYKIRKQYIDTIKIMYSNLEAIEKSDKPSEGFVWRDDDFYDFMNKIQAEIDSLTNGSYICLHIIRNKLYNFQNQLDHFDRSEEWKKSLEKQVTQVSKDMEDLNSCMKSVYSTGIDVLNSGWKQYCRHVDFDVSVLLQKIKNSKESAQKLMFEIYERALENPVLNRQKASSQVIKLQYEMTTQELGLQDDSFVKNIMKDIDDARDQWFDCFGKAIRCAMRNSSRIEQMKDGDDRLLMENINDILKDRCYQLEETMMRLLLCGNSLLIKYDEKSNQAGQNVNVHDDKELIELSERLQRIEKTMQLEMGPILEEVDRYDEQSFAFAIRGKYSDSKKSAVVPTYVLKSDMSKKSSKQGKDAGKNKKDTKDVPKENNSEKDGPADL